jgi:sulfur transfer protein SufE
MTAIRAQLDRKTEWKADADANMSEGLLFLLHGIAEAGWRWLIMN